MTDAHDDELAGIFADFQTALNSIQAALAQNYQALDRLTHGAQYAATQGQVTSLGHSLIGHVGRIVDEGKRAVAESVKAQIPTGEIKELTDRLRLNVDALTVEKVRREKARRQRIIAGAVAVFLGGVVVGSLLGMIAYPTALLSASETACSIGGGRWVTASNGVPLCAFYSNLPPAARDAVTTGRR